MKKTLAIAGVLALTITPTVSFADHLEPKASEIRPGGNLAHTNLFRASLSGADLSDANLSFINLRSADLSGADLSGAKLNGANLAISDLMGVDLSGADLSGAILKRADLDSANLSGAELSGADLRDITASNISGCPISLPSGWVCENNSLIQP
jgi:uncharacterized protein YjbI with pentapeptide repeats